MDKRASPHPVCHGHAFDLPCVAMSDFIISVMRATRFGILYWNVSLALLQILAVLLLSTEGFYHDSASHEVLGISVKASTRHFVKSAVD